MKYRHAVLVDNETATTATTKTVDLKGLDPISELVVQFTGTNNGGTPTAHPAKMVSKIELVDGSDVLVSLSGIEAQALAYYSRGQPLNQIISYLNDNNCRAMFPLHFGRWLWDEEFAFNPKAFTNPQLKITHNKASGGSAPDAGALDVVAKMFDEKNVSPMAFLAGKEHNSYSLTSSAVEEVDLPTDEVIRQIIVQSLSDGKAPNAQYNKIKLSENNGKKIPLEETTSDLIKYALSAFGQYREQVRMRAETSSVEAFITPTYETAVVGSPCDGSAGYPKITYSYGGTVDVVGAAAADVDLLVSGLCPHGATPLLFGDLWDANNWYDVTKLAKLQMKITAGSSVGSSSTCQTIVESVRRNSK